MISCPQEAWLSDPILFLPYATKISLSLAFHSPTWEPVAFGDIFEVLLAFASEELCLSRVVTELANHRTATPSGHCHLMGKNT